MSEVIKSLAAAGWVRCPSDALLTEEAISAMLGPPKLNMRGLAYTELLSYEAHLAPRNSMSSFVGRGQQPYHTDEAFVPVPPRYVVLQCVNPGEVPCPTQLMALDLASLCVDRPSRLTNQSWVVKGGGLPPFYAQILNVGSKGAFVRFDPCCMRAVSSEQSHVSEALDTIRDYATDVTVYLERNEILIIDNWRCLHRRADSSRSPSRHLRRSLRGGGVGLVR